MYPYLSEKRSTGSMCTLHFFFLTLVWWVLMHYIPARHIVFRRKGRNIYRRHCSIKPERESCPWCIVESVASIHHLHLSVFCRNGVLYMQRCWTPSQSPTEEILWLQEFTCPSCVSVHMDPNGKKLFLVGKFDILNVSWNKCALYSIMRQHITWCLKIMIYLFDRTSN